MQLKEASEIKYGEDGNNRRLLTADARRISILATRARSNLIAAAIEFWQYQFFEIADLIVDWVAIAIAIAPSLTALNLFED